MEAVFKWNEGKGNIVATFEGSGDGLVAVFSDIGNEGIDRTQYIYIHTTDGSSIYRKLTVSQPGLREVFNASGGLFYLSNGSTFNVLK